MEIIKSSTTAISVELEEVERNAIIYILFSIQIGAAIDQRILFRKQRHAVFEHGLAADKLIEIIDPGELERRSRKAKFRKEARERGISVSRKEINSNPEFNSQGAKVIQISFDDFEKLDRVLELAVTNEEAFDPFFFDIREVAEIQNDLRSLMNKAQSKLSSD